MLKHIAYFFRKTQARLIAYKHYAYANFHKTNNAKNIYIIRKCKGLYLQTQIM